MGQQQDNRKVSGRGTSINHSGRFEATEIELDSSQLEYDDEWQQEQQRPRTKYFEDTSRTVISENDSPDVPFRYSLNPYRGCLHGCSYCYARPSHEYLGLSAGLDFETKIFVKKRAPELFRRWLCRRGYVPEPVMMSGVTDSYQPVERILRITRGCLEVAEQAAQPMSIVTKNALVCRDLDLMTRMAERHLVRVAVSITSLDQSLTRVLEPATSAPAARLRAVEQLSSAGIPVHIMVAPVIPGLNDSEIPAILEAAAAAGARSSSHVLIRLPYSVKDIFTDWLAHCRPEQADKVLSRLARARDGRLNDTTFGRRMQGSGPMAEQIAALFRVTARRHAIDQQLPPLATAGFRPPDGQRRLF